jgi:hypothetical protein
MAELRERIFAAAKDRKAEPLEVPAWGVTVWVKVLTVRDQIDLAEHPEGPDQILRVVIAGLVDDTGAPVFTEDDVEALSDQEWPTIQEVFREVAARNGMTLRELDEAMEGLAPTPGESPSTG